MIESRSKPAPGQRPNILFIMSDDHTSQAAGAYGGRLAKLNPKDTSAFGRQCLLARRLVEKGVPFVQIFSGGWDSHDYLERAHTERIKSVDKPMAALIRDLKQRGMLKDTLVIWCGEFGRTPDNNKLTYYHAGRYKQLSQFGGQVIKELIT